MNQGKTNTPIKKNRVGSTIVNILLVLVLIFGIFCSYTAFVSKSGNGVPDFFGIRAFSIQSDSMEPIFYEGDLIIDVKVADPADLKIGDIITFFTIDIIKGERVPNTHRIVDIRDNGAELIFTTRGENSPDNNGDGQPDDDRMEVYAKDVIGKYRFAIPKLGSVIDFLQTGTGFLIVIVLPVFLFFIYNLVQFFRAFFNYRMQKMRLELQKEMEALQRYNNANNQTTLHNQNNKHNGR